MKQARVPTEAEMKRVFSVVSGMRYAARNRVALALSYYAGLRVSEIAGLRLKDALDEQRAVRDRLMLTGAITKSGEARAIYVGSRLRREIERYSAHRADAAPDDALIVSQRGHGFSGNTLCQLFKNIYELAGVDGASSHSGRRWFITRLAHSGISPKVIMTLAGHRHLSTTQRYIDVNDEMLRAAVEVL